MVSMLYHRPCSLRVYGYIHKLSLITIGIHFGANAEYSPHSLVLIQVVFVNVSWCSLFRKWTVLIMRLVSVGYILQLPLNFSNETTLYFQSILQLYLRGLLTSVYDLWWSYQQTNVPMFHLWPMLTCGRYCQMLTLLL